MGFDWPTPRVDHAPVAYPAVASRNGPVIKPDSVARLVGLGLERVQRELPAGVVEKEVVGLRHVVDARARGARLNDVQGDVDARTQFLARSRDYTLKGADPPWA
jgi:hypothetical protein